MNDSFTKTGLEQRGWTDLLILKHLGEPDQIFPNPHCSDHFIKLYRRSRVEEVEASQDFMAE